MLIDIDVCKKTVQKRVKQKRKQWLLQVAALWGTNCGKFLIFEITE